MTKFNLSNACNWDSFQEKALKEFTKLEWKLILKLVEGTISTDEFVEKRNKIIGVKLRLK